MRIIAKKTTYKKELPAQNFYKKGASPPKMKPICL